MALIFLYLAAVGASNLVCPLQQTFDATPVLVEGGNCYDPIPAGLPPRRNSSCLRFNTRSKDTGKAVDTRSGDACINGNTPQVTNFPACPHLSGKLNCRLNARGDMDFDENVCEVIDTWYNNGGKRASCLAALERYYCSFADPAVSEHFNSVSMQIAGENHLYEEFRMCASSTCERIFKDCESSEMTVLMGGRCKGALPLHIGRCQDNGDCKFDEACVFTDNDPTVSVCLKKCTKSSNCKVPCVNGATREEAEANQANSKPAPPAPEAEDRDGDDGGGALIVLLFLFFFATYCVVGVAYQRTVKKASGIQQIPNSAFWMGLLDCVVSLPQRICRRGGGGSSGSGGRWDGVSPPAYSWD